MENYEPKDGLPEKNLDESSEPKELTDIVNNEKGNAALGVAVAIVATPICAYLGSYVGEGFGWAYGNIIDFIPLVNDVAPWLAERAGLINDAKEVANLNEDLYQTTGSISGFWGGMALPWKVLLGVYDD